MFKDFMLFMYDLILEIPTLFSWLITPSSILGYDIAPIYLLIGSAILIAGIIRAIV